MSLTKLGRYDLIRVIGKGAMGLVYEGRDPNLERRVAIKTIRVEDLSQEAAADYEVRFRTEARSAARLQHPNIVSVYDSDRDGDTAFLVMEFIQGDDLKYHLDRGERYSLEQTLAIMGDLLAALDYAHRQGIVHRDIKPANLLIEPGGRVKLTDFGVARIQDAGDVTRTQGTMVGTLKYMAPEQVQGLPVDARADLFAAGIVLYQLLTGKRPFDGETDYAIIQQIVGHAPAAPSSFNSRLPPAIDAVMARALVKSREQRFATAQEFASALRAASQEAADPWVFPPPSPAKRSNSATWTDTLRDGEALLGLQSGTHSNISIVTQELELVYWKDIKDSSDAEDLQVFLAKFPTGIYAALARRRLRKLGVLAGEDTDIATPAAGDTLVMPRSASQLEKTLLVPRTGSSAGIEAGPEAIDLSWMAPELASVQAKTSPPAATPASAAGEPPASAPAAATVLMQQQAAAPPESPVIVQGPSSRPSLLPDPASKKPGAVSPFLSRRRSWALAGLVALAGAGLGFWSSLGTPPPAVVAATAAAPLTPDAAPPAPLTPPAALPALKIATPPAAASVMALDTPAPVAAVAAGAAAAKAAAALALAKKASANSKDRLDKAAPATLAGRAVPPSSAKAPAASDEPAALAAARVAVANPRQACEDRMLIGFLNCMTAQCAKPAFSRHPLCVERLVMERRRREAEQSLH